MEKPQKCGPAVQDQNNFYIESLKDLHFHKDTQIHTHVVL